MFTPYPMSILHFIGIVVQTLALGVVTLVVSQRLHLAWKQRGGAADLLEANRFSLLVSAVCMTAFLALAL